MTGMGWKRARRGEAGFTLVEAVVYLTIFVVCTGTIFAAEVLARKINWNEAAALEALGQVDRLFAAIAEDCDRATAVVAGQAGRAEIRFVGGASYVARDGSILRDGSPVVSGVREASFARPDPIGHPRLVRARVAVRRAFGPGEAFERAYERTFIIRNLEGDHRGGL